MRADEKGWRGGEWPGLVKAISNTIEIDVYEKLHWQLSEFFLTWKSAGFCFFSKKRNLVQGFCELFHQVNRVSSSFDLPHEVM
jgi:hypothetical protein